MFDSPDRAAFAWSTGVLFAVVTTTSDLWPLTALAFMAAPALLAFRWVKAKQARDWLRRLAIVNQLEWQEPMIEGGNLAWVADVGPGKVFRYFASIPADEPAALALIRSAPWKLFR